MQVDSVTIIFVVLAAFVLWKLRSLLGEREGFEQRFQNGPPASAPGAPAQPSPMELEWSECAERGGPVWRGFEEIAKAQRDFSPKSFLGGACSAYEMIVKAFSDGDEEALRGLTSPDVLAGFKTALDARKARGETMQTTLVGLNDAKIVEARVEKNLAIVAVRFDGQFITATHGPDGALVEGDPTAPANVIDIWTFARPHDSGAPNWTLVATSPGQ
ncbi:putative lipid-binding transport protein (Tim44 family) [Rhodoblastus sphagnicola]|nr:Tim44/TimA family putative adaptor protein [Rhodoblastus sphagnicola]MBB4199975.1 putative lipid-binding transport protein (Tim44 family) [Rhodoblastus sphagnicola]